MNSKAVKNTASARVIGIILISAAILGWLICLSGVVAIWAVRPSFTESVVSQVKVVRFAMETTVSGLELAQDSVSGIVNSMAVLEGAIDKAADTINATTGFIDPLINITGEKLPNTVSSIQDSVGKAQEGAGKIDDALRFLNSLPLVGGNYNPVNPLDKALTQVSEGLSNFQETFGNMSESLTNTRDGIKSVQQSVQDMGASVSEIKSNLVEAQKVMQQYQDLAQSVLDFLVRWGDRLPQIIAGLAFLFTIFFFWIAATQLGLFLQGWQVYQSTGQKQQE
jgi:hypothetical protein